MKKTESTRLRPLSLRRSTVKALLQADLAAVQGGLPRDTGSDVQPNKGPCNDDTFCGG